MSSKITHLLTLDRITPKDLENLTPAQHRQLAKTNTEKLARLTGEERDHFLSKIGPILSAATKTEIWEYNHTLISTAVADYMRQYGLMPNKSHLARQTGLSRATITKHFADHQQQPEHLAQMEQFKLMAPSVLAGVCKQALNGDVRAARLYLQTVGATGRQPSRGPITEQNNYIQVNNTILSQQSLKHLSPEQLNQIENIIMNI